MVMKANEASAGGWRICHILFKESTRRRGSRRSRWGAGNRSLELVETVLAIERGEDKAISPGQEER